jgi:hypothetical protein
MCLETAQILSTAHYLAFNSPLFYSPTHIAAKLISGFLMAWRKFPMAKTKVIFFLSFFICFNAASQYFANIITATLLDIILQVFDEGNKAAKSPHIRPFAYNVMAGAILPEFFPVCIHTQLQ